MFVYIDKLCSAKKFNSMLLASNVKECINDVDLRRLHYKLSVICVDELEIKM